jgi:hypothetical protein
VTRRRRAKNKNAALLDGRLIIGETCRFGQFARDATKKIAAASHGVSWPRVRPKTLKRLAQFRRANNGLAARLRQTWGKAGCDACCDSCA